MWRPCSRGWRREPHPTAPADGIGGECWVEKPRVANRADKALVKGGKGMTQTSAGR